MMAIVPPGASASNVFFSSSRLIEVGATETIFTHPDNNLTLRYVTGDFG